jgi:hypothetical protein
MIKYINYIYLMIELINIPIDILLLIYNFSGNNFIINKDIYNKIREGREKYHNHPIRIYYRLAEWKYVGEPNRVIINKLSSKLSPSLKVHCKTYVDISNIPIGYLKNNGNILPSIELEEKIIPNINIIESKERMYVYSKISTWNLYHCWTYEKERLENYNKYWISRKKPNSLILTYTIDGKITK